MASRANGKPFPGRGVVTGSTGKEWAMKKETTEQTADMGPELFSITIDRVQGYEFRVRFDKEQYPDLMADEPPPLGTDKAPDASRFLAAAVGNCLSASFLFSARKVRADLHSIHTTVKVWYARNATGRLRISKIKVDLAPEFDPADAPKIARCLEIFEDYCVVTQSVRKGIDVSVAVKS